jgi:hypothetical protein
MNNFSEIAPFLASSTAETDYLKEKRLLAEANARAAEAGMSIEKINALSKLREIRVVS